MLIGSGGEDETGGPSDLSLQDVTFCSEKPPDYKEYEEQPNSSYTMSKQGTKTFWMYANVSEISYEEVDQGKKVNFDAYFTLKSPEGKIIYENEHIVNDTQIYSKDMDLDTYYLVPNFSLRNIGQLEKPYGDYTVEIEIVDHQSGQSDEVITTFTIQQK